MTQDEIIEMARENFFRLEYDRGGSHEGYEFSLEELKAFAKLVAAKEREAVVDIAQSYCGRLAQEEEFQKEIRARGEA